MRVEVHYHGVHVANVDAPHERVENALEFAYQRTQNIEGSWSRPGNPDYDGTVTVIAPLRVHNGHEYGHRSSMMGDKFVANGRTFEVSAIGFKEIEQ